MSTYVEGSSRWAEHSVDIDQRRNSITDGLRLTERQPAPEVTTSNHSVATRRSSARYESVASKYTGKNGACEENNGPVYGIRSMQPRRMSMKTSTSG
jgi:hypothetical protein